MRVEVEVEGATSRYEPRHGRRRCVFFALGDKFK